MIEIETISAGRRVACAALLFAFAGCTRGGGSDTGELLEPVGILLQPEQLVVPVGQTAQLTATGLFEDRTSQDITHLVSWSSANPSIATASDGLDQEGVVTGHTVGGTKLTASLAGVESVPVTVNVTDAELIGLTVEPKSLDLATGDEVQLKAIAAYSDGNRADSSSQVRWITGDGSVATIASGGVLTAAGVGTTDIHADWDGTISPDVPVTVVNNASADLKIVEVEAESAADSVTVSVLVGNVGDKGAAGFFVDIWLDPSGTPGVGDYGDQYEYVEYLEPDYGMPLTFTFDASSGSHTIFIVADSEGSIDESNESNNTFSGSIDVSSGGSGPNLEITYFDYVADSEEIYFAVDVTNTGGEDVGQFYVDLYLDQTSEPELYSDGDQYVTVESLAAGDTTYADFLFEGEYCYYCYSWVLIDGYDYVEETDEDDNVGGPIYVWSE